DPATREEVDREIARLTADVGPWVPPKVDTEALNVGLGRYYQDARTQESLRRRNLRFMTGGGLLLGLGHAGAFLSGAVLLAQGCWAPPDASPGAKQQWAAANSLLMVPLVGPFLAALVEPSPAWSLSWIFGNGAMQVAGLTLVIIGARSNLR